MFMVMFIVALVAWRVASLWCGVTDVPCGDPSQVAALTHLCYCHAAQLTCSCFKRLFSLVAMAGLLVDDRDLKQILNHKRLADDGVAYTKQEFQDFYGELPGHHRWLQADPARVASASSACTPVLADSADVASASSESGPIQSPLPLPAKCPPLPAAHSWEDPHVQRPKRQLPIVDLPQPHISTVAPVPERFHSSHNIVTQSAVAPVPESPHNDVTQLAVAPVPFAEPVNDGRGPAAMQPVVEQALQLMPQDVIAIQQAERDRGPPRSLHRLARTALNDIENREQRQDVNLDNVFPWREYVCQHGERAAIIGTGIVQARAVFFHDQRDLNRGGAPRLDLCFFKSDGTVCRVHPGKTQRADAKLRFFEI